MVTSRLIPSVFLAVVFSVLTTWEMPTVPRSLLHNAAAVEAPPERSLAELSSGEADFRG